MRGTLFEGSETDRPGLALALVIVALTCLSFQDALVKLVSDRTTLWQFQLIRSASNLVILVVFLRLNGELSRLWPKQPGRVALRSGIMIGTMVLFFAGAPFLTLAEMGAGLYTYPVFMTLLGWLVLREKVGIWRFSALALAAIGALLIVAPWQEGFRMAQLLPVGAGFCYALSAILLRRELRAESPFTLAVWIAGGFFLTSLSGAMTVSILPIAETSRAAWPFLLDVWPTLTLAVFGLAVTASIFNVLGNLMIVRAYQSAELSWIAPFDYSYLILATGWGFILFAELPGPRILFGMALIAVGGIVTAWRTGLRAGPDGTKPGPGPV